jgi:hypothetical protein
LQLLRLFFLFFFPVIARAKKKEKDGNYYHNKQYANWKKKNRKFSSLRKPSPKALRLMPVA